MNTKAIAKFRKNVDERIKNASPLKVLWMMLHSIYGF